MILVSELVFAISISVCIYIRFQYLLIGENMQACHCKDDESKLNIKC